MSITLVTYRVRTPFLFAPACKFHPQAKLYAQPLSGTYRCAKCAAVVRP